MRSIFWFGVVAVTVCWSWPTEGHEKQTQANHKGGRLRLLDDYLEGKDEDGDERPHGHHHHEGLNPEERAKHVITDLKPSEVRSKRNFENDERIKFPPLLHLAQFGLFVLC